MIGRMATYKVTDHKDDHDVLAEFEALDNSQAEFLGRHHALGLVYKLWVQQANGDWLAIS